MHLTENAEPQSLHHNNNLPSEDPVGSVRDRGKAHGKTSNTLNRLRCGKGRELNKAAPKVAMKLVA